MARHKAFTSATGMANSSATKARFPDHDAPIPGCHKVKTSRSWSKAHRAEISDPPRAGLWMTTVVGANPVRMRFREANIQRST